MNLCVPKIMPTNSYGRVRNGLRLSVIPPALDAVGTRVG